MTDLDSRLDEAWVAIFDAKDDPNFDALYEDIENRVLVGLAGDDRNIAIESLNAYLWRLGKADRTGFI